MKCTQSGCAGVIEDGFCNVCGLEPASVAVEFVPPPLPTGGTTRFGTVALPSMRTGTVAGSGTVGSGLSGSATGKTGTGSSRRGSRGTRSSTRRQLGLGLVQVPELPPLDPTSVIMADPVVPEDKRFCNNCNEKLKREKGFCPKCGRPYSLSPTLKAGDIVSEQYEVVGCMAFGGLGWIYLAKDKVLSRWVVLKGLLNAQDEASAAAAVAERQFLAAVKHANIVGVYNFVQRGSEGYIVMEYVGGKSLKVIRRERGPLPVAEAIAYIHRILGAFAYLHRQNPPLVYCDFKPDNFMLEGDDVKLIDMGGVRRVDDPGGDIYGTKGYSAPEAGDGPTIVSDLFTIARTLAVMVCEFRGYRSTYEFTIPTPEEQPIFAQHESLYRFLVKATRANPDERFQTADEMADQLAGVLREIVSLEQKAPHPADSLFFGGDASGLQSVIDEKALLPSPALIPGLKVDVEDPAAQFLLANTSGALNLERQISLYTHAVSKFSKSMEARLRLAKSLIEAEKTAEAETHLKEAETVDPWDWRVTWTRGISYFHAGLFREAAAHFDHVYSELPGEIAVKLALALTAEATGEKEYAARLYNIVSISDPSYTSAAFGLARCLAEAHKKDDAIAAYHRVPPSSNAYTQAQIALARAWIRTTQQSCPAAEDLQQAAQIIEALALDAIERHRLAVEIQQLALDLLKAQRLPATPQVRIFGNSLLESQLRKGIESALRGLARLVNDRHERIGLIDLANEIRPLSLF